MKTTLFICAIFFCGAVLAEGSPLVTPGDETKLTAAERVVLAKGREQRHYTAVTPVTINRNAMLSNVIAYDGVEYVKEAVQHPHDLIHVTTWQGRAKSGATLSLSSDAGSIAGAIVSPAGEITRLFGNAAGRGFSTRIDPRQLPDVDEGDGTANIKGVKAK